MKRRGTVVNQKHTWAELTSAQSKQSSGLRLFVNITHTLQKLSNAVCVYALTYLDSPSHHNKTITEIFLVMRLSAGTRGYGTHIQTSHDMTHPTKLHLQICA